MTTLQQPQMGVIVFECLDSWDDCQKKQAKAKAGTPADPGAVATRPGRKARRARA